MSARPPYCPERGDYIWIDFEPQSGREITKYRPAIVLSPYGQNMYYGMAIVCPLTSTRGRHPSEVAVVIDGKSSIVKPEQIRSLDWRSRRAKLIGRAEESVMEEVLETLAALLGIA